MPSIHINLLAASTATGWLGAYSAMAAGLSLILTMWPFVAAAGDKVRQIGNPTRKLGLKRSAGWFFLANLACLVASVGAGYVGQAWDALAPLVNDPIFQLTRQEWAIVLDLLPFLVFSVAVGTAALWGLNLIPPRPERVRRSTLALLAAGQNLLTYTLAGLVIWQVEIPTMGGYGRILPSFPADYTDYADSKLLESAKSAESVGNPAQSVGNLRAGQRIWYIASGGGAVHSIRPGNFDDRVEWAGPVPRPVLAMWLIDAPGVRRLVFVATDRLSIVELPGGKLTTCPAAPTKEGDVARPPATPAELARVLNVPAAWIWPRDPCRPALAGYETLTASMAKQIRQAGDIDRQDWLRRHGEGLAMPTIPSRPPWHDQQDIQPLGPDLIVANYGYRLLVFCPHERWLAPLNVSAEAFVIAPEAPMPIPAPSTRPDN